MKSIQTNRYYGEEPRIIHIFNGGMGDQFPTLFDRFWEVYETWYEHEDLVTDGNSTFLVDNALVNEDRLWRRERFGNYLYGALFSLYFSWSSLEKARSQRRKSGAKSDLAAVRQVNDVVRYLFTALDALACCLFLAEGKPANGVSISDAEEKHLRFITINSVKNRAGNLTGYSMIDALKGTPEFEYLSEYRNILTHRPFPQFHIDADKKYHLPLSLSELDSSTQRNNAYQQEDLGSFLTRCYGLFTGSVEQLLNELNFQYRSRM